MRTFMLVSFYHENVLDLNVPPYKTIYHTFVIAVEASLGAANIANQLIPQQVRQSYQRTR
jgi:hypothetical protein